MVVGRWRAGETALRYEPQTSKNTAQQHEEAHAQQRADGRATSQFNRRRLQEQVSALTRKLAGREGNRPRRRRCCTLSHVRQAISSRIHIMLENATRICHAKFGVLPLTKIEHFASVQSTTHHRHLRRQWPDASY